MAIREYDFVDTGVETPAQPDASDPSGDGDYVTLGYLEEHYAPVTLISITSTSLNGAISGLIVDYATYKGAYCDFVLDRYTDSENFQIAGRMWMFYDFQNSSWRLSVNTNGDDELINCTFTIHTTTGQVSVSSGSLSGSNPHEIFRGHFTKIVL